MRRQRQRVEGAVVAQRRDAALDRLAQCFRGADVAPEGSIVGDIHRRSKEQPKIMDTGRPRYRTDEIQHGALGNIAVPIFYQLGIKACRGVGASQRSFADFITYERWQTLQNTAGNDGNRGYRRALQDRAWRNLDGFE